MNLEELAIKLAKGNNGGEWATHYNEDQKNFWRAFAKEIIDSREAEALTAFQRYKETKWLDVPSGTLNELLHLIQAKEYQRGYDDGADSHDIEWNNR